MATWIFEPGHTEAEFRARHMMVTWVRGLFKDIHGRLELDWDHCLDATFEGEIDAAGIWTGEPDATSICAAPTSSTSRTPKITFSGRFTDRTGGTTFKGEVELTIRGVTRRSRSTSSPSGMDDPFWVGDENKGEMRRIGFEATAGSTAMSSGSPGRRDPRGRGGRRQPDRSRPRRRSDPARGPQRTGAIEYLRGLTQPGRGRDRPRTPKAGDGPCGLRSVSPGHIWHRTHIEPAGMSVDPHLRVNYHRRAASDGDAMTRASGLPGPREIKQVDIASRRWVKNVVLTGSLVESGNRASVLPHGMFQSLGPGCRRGGERNESRGYSADQRRCRRRLPRLRRYAHPADGRVLQSMMRPGIRAHRIAWVRGDAGWPDAVSKSSAGHDDGGEDQHLFDG